MTSCWPPSRRILRSMKHIIWDWNGTLLNDLPVIIKAVNHTLEQVGLPQITLEDYRTYYTRPVKKFYDQIAGRDIGHDDWTRIDGLFHERYHAMVGDASLASGANEVLAELDAGPNEQSLLSMAPQDELLMALELFGVSGYFSLAEGNTGAPGGFKADHLASHLERLETDKSRVTMIGDTIDDGDAAIENGIACVLFDDGSHHRHDLEALGLPIADLLAEAVEVALR